MYICASISMGNMLYLSVILDDAAHQHELREMTLTATSWFVCVSQALNTDPVAPCPKNAVSIRYRSLGPSRTTLSDMEWQLIFQQASQSSKHTYSSSSEPSVRFIRRTYNPRILYTLISMQLRHSAAHLLAHSRSSWLDTGYVYM